MASGDTKTNQYLDIAANGTRADLPADACCETRSQTLIRGVAERIITEEETRAREDAILQGEIDEIKSSPDVVDIVATYAALQDYSTQHLNNNDVIRVLADETHQGQSTYYRFTKNPDTWTFIGTIGDYYTKTQLDQILESKQDELTAGENITIEEESGALVISATGGGSTYTAGDGIDITNDVISATNTGKLKVLTSADYNYHSTGDTDDTVALWLLESGVYTYTDSSVKVRQHRHSTSAQKNTLFIVSHNTDDGFCFIIEFAGPGYKPNMYVVDTTTGSSSNQASLVRDKDVVNNLTDGGTTVPLSAQQGKVLKELIGKGKALTSSDFNWNSSTQTTTNPNCVALWLLEDGLYEVADTDTTPLYANTSTRVYPHTVLIGTSNAGRKEMLCFERQASSATASEAFMVLYITTTSGSSVGNVDGHRILDSEAVVDSLSSTKTNAPLSANQGKVLKALIDGLAISGAGAPTTSTVGTVGKLYEDTTNGKLYICTDTTGGTYTWAEVGAGGGVTALTSADYNYPTDNPTSIALWSLPTGLYKIGGSSNVNIKYNTGDAQTAVSPGTSFFILSESGASNRVCIMQENDSTPPKIWLGNTNGAKTLSGVPLSTLADIYADPNTKQRVQIGSGAGAGTEGVALGYGAYADANAVAIGHGADARGAGSVAIGDNCNVSGAGIVGIGTITTSRGYNSSNYRLLTGVYDGQSAHDAVNLGQLQNAIINGGTTAPTTATVGAVGTLYAAVESGTAHLYACTAIDTTDPSNPVYTWSTLI